MCVYVCVCVCVCVYVYIYKQYSTGTKTEIKKWDLIKLESFCTAKETINEMKRPCSEWQKIFAKLATDKGLISKVYKQLMQFYVIKQPSKKMRRDLNRCFSFSK